jgi:cell division protein FtsB
MSGRRHEKTALEARVAKLRDDYQNRRYTQLSQPGCQFGHTSGDRS